MSNLYGLPITHALSFTTKLTGFTMVTAVVEIIIYLTLVGCTFAGLALMFKKAGEKPYKSIVPIYNIYTLYKLVWTKQKFMTWFVPSAALLFLSVVVRMFTTGIIPAILCMLACLLIAFFHILVSDKIANAFGEGTSTTIGLMLLTPIYYMLVGCGDNEYSYEQVVHTPKEKKQVEKKQKLTKEEKQQLKIQAREEKAEQKRLAREMKADKKANSVNKVDKAEKMPKTVKAEKPQKTVKAEKADKPSKSDKKQAKLNKKEEKRAKAEANKRAAMKKREKAEAEAEEKRKNKKTKKSKKELKAEQKRFDRDSYMDGQSDADFFVKRDFDAEGNIQTPIYELSPNEKRILANLKMEKAQGNFKRELTVEERLALERLRQVRAIGM